MEGKTQKKTETATPWSSINGRDRWLSRGMEGSKKLKKYILRKSTESEDGWWPRSSLDSIFRDMVMDTELRGKRPHTGGVKACSLFLDLGGYNKDFSHAHLQSPAPGGLHSMIHH